MIPEPVDAPIKLDELETVQTNPTIPPILSLKGWVCVTIILFLCLFVMVFGLLIYVGILVILKKIDYQVNHLNLEIGHTI
jgi:hypothetical protein